MNRIMLKFRPIAPKPPGGVPAPDASENQRKNGAGKKGIKRAKRKYVRVKSKTIKSPPEKSGIEEESPPESEIVTLQLLPGRSESDNSCNNNSSTGQTTKRSLMVRDFSCNREVMDSSHSDMLESDHSYNNNGIDQMTKHNLLERRFTYNRERSAIETWVMVECVTDTSIHTEVGLGFSDKDKIKNLEVDTCPGFVSDKNNNVVWVNEAHRKMVAAEGQGVIVWLVVKEKLPYFYPSFACKVRLIQHTREGQKWNRIVACDVWRMEFGGFAWRLDVDTALGLGI